jgi:hypothetical protein
MRERGTLGRVQADAGGDGHFQQVDAAAEDDDADDRQRPGLDDPGRVHDRQQVVARAEHRQAD